MFIDVVPNRDSPPAVLLREAYRDEHGRVRSVSSNRNGRPKK